MLPVFCARILGMLKKKYLWGLVVLYLMFIFGNSMRSGEVSGSLSMEIAETVAGILKRFNIAVNDFHSLHYFIRKRAHFSEFFILGLLVQRVNSRQPLMKNEKLVFLLFLLTGFADEFIQLFAQERAGKITDSLIDCSGYISGWVIVMLIKKAYRHRR